MNDTSETESGSPEETSALPEGGSVYDFMYHDARRVGSFVAQITGLGLMTRASKTTATGRDVDKSRKRNFGGNIAGVGGINVGWESGPGAGRTDTDNREYDPYWINAVNLLDLLEQRNLVRRDIALAALGDVVLVTGELVVTDMSLIKGLLSLPEARENAVEAAATEVAKNNPQASPAHAMREASRTTNVLAAMVDVMPHLVHGRLVAPNGEAVWSVLRDEAMVGSASDLTLKHGASTVGTWTMLGILDALPDPPPPQPDADGNLPPSLMELTMRLALGTGMVEEWARMMPLARNMGRPEHAYGMTPLLIFREVSSI